METRIVITMSDLMGGMTIRFDRDEEVTGTREAERLWQFMSEEARPEMSVEDWESSGRAADWEDLPDGTPEELLNAAQESGFVDSWDVEEVES